MVSKPVVKSLSIAMDVQNKSRITQNIVYMKSTLSHLDPIIDRLIEGGIFGLSDRNRIEAESAPYKQFNICIDILVTSPETNAYKIFRKALKSEGYAVLADKLDETSPRSPAPRSASSRQSTRRVSIVSDGTVPDSAGASGKSSPSNRSNDYLTDGSTVRNALECFNRNQQTFMTELQRLREIDWAKMEEQRRQDKEEMHRQMGTLKNSYDQEHDATVITNRYLALQEKYDHLKEVQKGMRVVDSERRDKLATLNKDYVVLNTKYQQLQQAYAGMEKEMGNMQDLLSNAAFDKAGDVGLHTCENIMLVEQLKTEKHDLMLQLEKKLAEIANLQNQIHEQTELIEQNKSGHENMRSTKEIEREQKFDKMYEMVETMVKERTVVVEDTRKPEQRLKAYPALNTSRMQLKERQGARTKMPGTKPFKVQLGMDECN